MKIINIPGVGATLNTNLHLVGEVGIERDVKEEYGCLRLYIRAYYMLVIQGMEHKITGDWKYSRIEYEDYKNTTGRVRAGMSAGEFNPETGRAHGIESISVDELSTMLCDKLDITKDPAVSLMMALECNHRDKVLLRWL